MNRLASVPLSPLKGSGQLILDLAVLWFCNAAVRLETCWASRLISCSVLWGTDIGVCDCAGVWLWDAAGAGGGGVAEAEAGFEERWVAGGKSNPIGYTTRSLPEWSVDGNGTEVVRRSEAFGHG